jgi:serine/threonine-protein kinase HipA
MKRCPITYDVISTGRYSERGLRMLARNLKQLAPLPFSAEEQRQEAVRRAGRMSIQGVQPKLSARLNAASGIFEAVDTGGTYILKPQSDMYPELPENEDLTMRLAASAGLEVPLHGMVYAKDRSLTYFIKRFDRAGRKEKLAMEDFAQLQGKSRNTKYDSSMERVAQTVEEFCTFPVVEKAKLFRLTLFNFITGNEDMHLKNFSIIRRDGKVELSPAYDLLNTSIAIENAAEELALPLRGKKRRITAKDLIQYFGQERLGLTERVIHQTVQAFVSAKEQWLNLIEISFLSDKMKAAYTTLLEKRAQTAGIRLI